MKNIGIIGAGIAGLHLGLYLQQHGIKAIIYSDKTPEQMRAGRVPNFVVRFDHTRERERALGVEHWDNPDFDIMGVHMHISGQTPVVWKGTPKRPMSGVDMRVYQSALLEDFVERGGKVVYGVFESSDLSKLAEEHDLIVVASGRGSLTQMFPRDPFRSPYGKPQRFLTGAFYRGLKRPDPLSIIYTISPGNGEIFQAPYITLNGQMVCNILFESIPGGAFDRISHIRYDDEPKKFETTVLELVSEYAPLIYKQINTKEFGVLRPLDVLQGAITPTVRRGYIPLGKGKFALALGDVHILNDPVLGQGANAASKCAWTLGQSLIEDRPLNEDFCLETEEKLWEASRAATEWTNAALQPPPPHAVEVYVAAANNKTLADELADNFNAPERSWAIFSDPVNASAFLQKHSAQMVAV